jgi:anthranilate synthase component 2
MRVLLIDNFDSFTFNLVHIIEKYATKVDVIRNNNLENININNYDKLLISPGPGLPNDSGDLIPFLKKNAKKISCLGICLGHQALAQIFGSKLLNISNVKHGVTSIITEYDSTDYLFKDINGNIEIGHYHSWVVDNENLGNNWLITSKSEDLIMSISHKKYDIKGIQFHPESIMTKKGEKILENWLFN